MVDDTRCCKPGFFIPKVVTAPTGLCSTTCEEESCPSSHTICLKPSVLVISEWNVPGCTAYAVINVQNPTQIVVGAYLFHPTFGYFKVAEVNVPDNQVRLQSYCINLLSPIGTHIPGGTLFLQVDSPEGPGQQTGSFLAVNFVAPAVNDCVTISVTSTTNIILGTTIGIGSAKYLVKAVSGPTSLFICNMGEGFPANTIVQAKSTSGIYQYPISIIPPAFLLNYFGANTTFDISITNTDAGANASLLIYNPSSLKSMLFNYFIRGSFNGQYVYDAVTPVASLQYSLQSKLYDPSLVLVDSIIQSITKEITDDASCNLGEQLVGWGNYIIPPGPSYTLEIGVNVAWLAGTGSYEANQPHHSVNLYFSGLGVCK